jgi:hypothetical protein
MATATSLTRRSALTAGTAALVTGTGASIGALAIAQDADNPDAVLLALATALDALEQEWLAMRSLGATDRLPWNDDDNSPWDPIVDRVHSLTDDILGRRSCTIDGLTLQVRALRMATCNFEDEVGGYKATESFVEAVCAFVGITPVEDLSHAQAIACSRFSPGR